MIKEEILSCLKEMIREPLKIKQIVLNSGFTGAVLDNGSMGMAMNVRSGCTADKKIQDFLQGKINTEALSTCEDLLEKMGSFNESPDGRHLLHSVLIALYNALSKPFLHGEYLQELGCRLGDDPEQAPSGGVRAGETVTIVGFGGMVRPLAQTAGKVYVTELEPDLFASTLFSEDGVTQGPDCCTIVPSARGKDFFEKADTVFITGCSLVTDTMDEILQQCRGKNIIVYGATAGFWPRPLLERGVRTIRTLHIKDKDLMVDLLLNCAGAVERFFPMASENMVIVKNM